MKWGAKGLVVLAGHFSAALDPFRFSAPDTLEAQHVLVSPLPGVIETVAISAQPASEVPRLAAHISGKERVGQLLEEVGFLARPRHSPSRVQRVLDEQSRVGAVRPETPPEAALDCRSPFHGPAPGSREPVHRHGQQVADVRVAPAIALLGVDGDEIGRRQVAVLGRDDGVGAVDVEGEPHHDVGAVELDVAMPQGRLARADPHALFGIVCAVRLRRDQ